VLSNAPHIRGADEKEEFQQTNNRNDRQYGKILILIKRTVANAATVLFLTHSLILTLFI
jgi:hypothetical protein